MLSLKGEEHIYPSYRGLACPYGPAAERVCGSRGSQRVMYGLFSSVYLSMYLYIYLSIHPSIYTYTFHLYPLSFTLALTPALPLAMSLFIRLLISLYIYVHLSIIFISFSPFPNALFLSLYRGSTKQEQIPAIGFDSVFYSAKSSSMVRVAPR